MSDAQTEPMISIEWEEYVPGRGLIVDLLFGVFTFGGADRARPVVVVSDADGRVVQRIPRRTRKAAIALSQELKEQIRSMTMEEIGQRNLNQSWHER